MSSTACSAFVDSASPGRNDVDSFCSASAYFVGRLAPMTTSITPIHAARTIHFARRPDARVRSFDMGPFPSRRCRGVNRNAGSGEVRLPVLDGSGCQQLAQILRIGHRSLTCEALAHV